MTQYQFSGCAPFGPRCQNMMSLTPLYAGCTSFEPVPLMLVPPEYFWQNSEGYGFDIRDIAVLIRTNFRNLNPHTVNLPTPPRPLWCNERDMLSLIYHPMMPGEVRANIHKRIAVLNFLQDETKVRLATLAAELYSHSLQGFFDWLRETPDDVLIAMEITTPKSELLNSVMTIAAERRHTAICGIVQHAGVQANRHAVEPTGIPTTSHLYTLLEMYKATVVSGFFVYADRLRQQTVNVVGFDDRLYEYMQIQFLGLCARYVLLLKKEPRHFAEMQLWHWTFRVPLSTTGMVARRHGRLRQSLLSAPQRLAGEHLVHVRVFFHLATNEFVVTWPDGSRRFRDAGDLWLFLQTDVPRLLAGNMVGVATLGTAAISGGIHQLCRTPRWKRNFKYDNLYIYTMARLFLLGRPAFRYLHEYVEKMSPFPRDDAFVRKFIRDTYGVRVAKGFRQLLNEYVLAIPRIFEFHAMCSIRLEGGYDNAGARDLLTKLRGAMDGNTCVQDVAAELCEFLSVPFPPEQPQFAAFQVDHTGIPELVRD